MRGLEWLLTWALEQPAHNSEDEIGRKHVTTNKTSPLRTPFRIL
jgi:hypothetical protein